MMRLPGTAALRRWFVGQLVAPASTKRIKARAYPCVLCIIALTLGGCREVTRLIEPEATDDIEKIGLREISIDENIVDIIADPLRPFLYALNATSYTLLTIDCTNDKVLDEVDLGASPVAMDIASDATTLFVALSNPDQVVVIDLATRTRATSIALASSPTRIKSGRPGRAYVIRPKNTDSRYLSIIDVINAVEVHTADVPSVVSFTLSDNGTRLWMSNGSIYDIGSDTMSLVSSFSTGETAPMFASMDMDSAEKRLYCRNGITIDAISTQSRTKIGAIVIGGLYGFMRDSLITPSGNISYAITIDEYPIEDPVESYLVVSNNESLAPVSMYKLSRGIIAKKTTGAGHIIALSMHTQGLYVVVGSADKNDILRIDIEDI